MRREDGDLSPDVLDLLLDVVCVVDEQGRFRSVRGACERIFGYLPEEMIGRPMIEFVHPDDQERTLRQVDRIMAGYLQRYFENRYVRKDGRPVHIMWSARWLESEGIRVAVGRDISDRDSVEPTQKLPHQPAWRLSSSPPRLFAPDGVAIELSNQDFQVLQALASGHVVSREAVVRALGHDYFHYDQRRLDTQMRRLRRRVEAACGQPLPVCTLRAVGFRFYESIKTDS